MEKYEEEKMCISKGYKFLGWQVHSGNCEEIKKCVDLGHNILANGFWHSKQHNPRGSDNTHWCDACKIYWKIDSSD